MSRWLKCTSMHLNTDWNKYDDRLMKAVERGEVDKVSAVLNKKGIIPTKLDVEGRSAFHLAATRGHLDCLNLILGHTVDITASDATGKNALHLASRNGHSLCVQKLLQHNCPVGNVDLQGRTALHDAVMAGCSSSVKLLCDSGASVNTSDFDGRTPLILATQMCHPRICQLLLERGADVSARDKQNKTALILGCEFGCRDAVEVLLKTGIDVKAVDGTGHDALHYARLSKNPELAAMLKNYIDKANRDREAVKIEQWKRQHSVERSEAAEASRRDQIIHDLERQNENLQESLRKYHQDQKALLDKVNMLQQQLLQEKITVEDTQKEKEQLKVLLSAKDREAGARGPDTVKVQLRSVMGEYSGQSVIKGKENVLVKQAHSLDSDHMLQSAAASRSLSRPPERGQPGGGRELEALRQELEAVRRRQQAAEEEAAQLQSALNRKNRECQELVQSRDSVQTQADRQVQELEDALGDVQKRMLDSECKVKQLQAHVEAVKEHLGGQGAEELRAQLQEVKAKYEGASAEVCRVRNRLKQSEKALEEYKGSEGQLAAEAEHLQRELGALAAERDELAEALLELKEARLKEARTNQGHTVPAEKFDNMKNLLSNAVDEKERQLAELREDYDRALEEVADLHRKLDAPPTVQGGGEEEHQRVRAALEEQNATLKRKLVEVTAKSQALIQELEESEEERDLLREHLDELNGRLEGDFVPLKDHEEVRKNMVSALEELEDKLVEASERFGKAEAQIQQLQEAHRREAEALKLRAADLTEQLDVLQKRCEDRDEECERLGVEKEALTRSLEEQHVPRQEHEREVAELRAALERAKAETAKFETGEKESGEELKNVKEGNEKLKDQLEKVMSEMKKDYISVQEHRAAAERLNAAVAEAENRANEASAARGRAQEETLKLRQELEAQKKELDTIQEAIQSKFVPLTTAEEKETSYSARVKELSGRLQEAEEKCEREKSAREGADLENNRLKAEVESVLQRLDAALASGEQHRGAEGELRAKCEEAEQQRAELLEEKALARTEIQSLQERLRAELTRIATYDTELKTLHDAMQQAQADCQRAREAQQEEAQRAGALHKELQRLQEAQQEEAQRAGALQEELQRLQEAQQEEAQRLQEAQQEEAQRNGILHRELQGLQEAQQEEAQRAGALHRELQGLQEAHQEEAQRAGALHKELQGLREDQASLQEQHAALQAEATKLRAALREEEETSAQRAEDVSALQSELLQATQALEEIRRREEQTGLMEKEKQQLEEEAANLSKELRSAKKESEEARREATQAREGESRIRKEMEALQERRRSIEREIGELKQRYDESLGTICDLQKRIQTSAQQTEAKDKKITELLTDVERLKQALNGLSQLAYTSSAPKRQAESLQAQIKGLQQQLADAERQHREVVSIYRTHLLSAAQGHMDEDVQAALLQIIRMRQEFVC
ncbi:uveal autoantigen with coiled-coil domains and ankyrin repeats isoform 2-T2 [Menidia menidia]